MTPDIAPHALESEGKAAALAILQRALSLAGWTLEFADLDVTRAAPQLDLRARSHEGRWIHARIDALGRASLERHQRSIALGLPSNLRGRQPRTPVLEDRFLGRLRFDTPAALLRALGDYIAENSPNALACADLRIACTALHPAPQGSP